MMMTMKWGLDKADATGLDAFVEATEAGWEMYKAAGFITVDNFWADAETDSPTQEWGNVREDLKFPMHGYFMCRSPGVNTRRGRRIFPGIKLLEQSCQEVSHPGYRSDSLARLRVI